MSDVTVKSQLEGFYKEVYGDKLENLIPEIGKLVRAVPFRETEKLGNAYNCPVIVSDEQGATYGGPDEDAFTMDAPEAMATKNARVKGSQIVMRAAIGYKAAASAVASGKAAFGNATELVIKRLMSSITKRVEIMLLYGQSGLGESDGSTNVSATETIVDFTTASFAAGLWVGMKGAKIEFWDETGPAQIGTTFTVGKVDIVARTLNVTGLAADITALDIFLAAAPPNAVVYFKGARGKEALGLDKVITTSGTLFEIDNTIYDLFKGREFDCLSGALDFDKLSKAMVQLINYGLEGDVLVWVNPITWESLNQDEAALRNYDYSYKPGEAQKGNRKLSYNVQNSNLEIVAHPMIKEGEGFIVQKDVLQRVGAWDVSMKNPGRGNEMFRELTDQTGFELRAYTDQALFSDHPSHLLKLKNIVNP